MKESRLTTMARRGLTFPGETREQIRKTGIRCRPQLEIVYQQRANQWKLRGEESGGAVADLGPCHHRSCSAGSSEAEDSKGCTTGQHWNLPELVREKINPILRGWGNYFKLGNSRKHFLSIAKYTTYVLTIMLGRSTRSGRKGGGTIRHHGSTTTKVSSSFIA